MTDLRIQATENMVGANHPSLPDTLNRLVIAEHNNDGTHKYKPNDLRYYMDGQSGRPTYATWYANQSTTDVTSVIVAALAANQATGSEIVPLAGTLAISSKITIGNGSNSAISTIHNGLKFIMAGMSFSTAHFPNNVGGTTFLWIGVSADYMFEIDGPISGLEFGKFDCDCNGVALGGLAAYHPFSSKFRSLNVKKFVGKDNGLTGASRIIDAGIIVEARPQGAWGGTAGGRGTINNSWEQVMTNEPSANGANGIRIGAIVISQSEYDVLQNTFLDCRFVYKSGTNVVATLAYTGAASTCIATYRTTVGDQNLYVRSGTGEYFVFSFATYTTLATLKTAVEATGVLSLSIVGGHTTDATTSLIGFQSADITGAGTGINQLTAANTGRALILSDCDNNSFYNTITGGFAGSAPNASLLITPPWYTGTTSGNFVQNSYVTWFPAEVGFFNCAIIGGIATENNWSAIGGAGVYFFPYPIGDGESVPNIPGIWGFTASGTAFGSGTLSDFIVLNNGDTTPNVTNIKSVQTSSGGASITNFTGAKSGQLLNIIFSNGSTTIVHGTTSDTIALADGVNYVGVAAEVLVIQRTASGRWIEVCRSRPAATPPTAWTPALTFATPNGFAPSYVTQEGRIAKIGKMRIAQFNININPFPSNTASGELRITGLTDGSTSAAGYISEGALRFGGITKAGYTNFTCEIGANATYIRCLASGSGQTTATVNAADIPIGGSFSIGGTLVYFVD